MDREIGASKLKIKTIIEYAQQVVDIAVCSLFNQNSAVRKEWDTVIRFGIVGISGIVVNLGILYLLVQFLQINDILASGIATEVSILNNFFWNDLWTFHAVENRKYSSRWQRLAAFNIVSAGGVAINLGIFYLLTRWFAVYYLLAQLVGILIAFTWNFLINRNLTWKKAPSPE